MVSSVISAVVGSNAANKAADTQANAAQQAADTTWRMYNQNREDTMPWLEQGTAAINKLGTLLGTSGSSTDDGYGSLLKSFGTSDFEADPGYQFRLSEGQKALERSAAARNGLLSGAATKAANNYAQNTASDEYQNAYNRYNTNQTNIYNRLAGVAGSGQTAANTLGTSGANAATSANDYMTSGASARANASVDKANQWTSGLNSLTSSLFSASRGGF